MNSATLPGAAPLVSIVITCFNYARFVAAAIEGALAQTYPRTEIVVVNDGSTDDSAQVIGRYRDRVRIIDQPNGGSVSALNRGFAESRGDIVMFLDADDLMAPEAAASVVAAWNPGCAKAQYDLTIIDADGRDLGRRFCSFRSDYDAAAVRASFWRTGTYRWPVTAGNAYARWFAGPFFPLAIDHGADGTLNTLAPLYGDVVTIARPLGAYRIHGANMWASGGSDTDRMPERIRHRRGEIALLREHAARKGVALPAGDILDHELPFLNYRLGALKLGMDYQGKDVDSVAGLLTRAGRAIVVEALPVKVKLAHLAWFVALGLAPGPLAARMLWLRYNRAAVRGAGRRLLDRLRQKNERNGRANVDADADADAA
ncbi:MAG TPA: glycosyltransferase family A protein [Polyangia bacterium]|nr:glycosyltransferase family A protein [Polyangia bacterium]